MMETKKPEFNKVSDYIWEISKDYREDMRVPVRVYSSRALLDEMDLQVYDQISNVATLPGIQKYAYCMPDGHSGYGFPIGGVAAMDSEDGVISPGGIGFDINCGMRLIRTNLTIDDVQPKLRELIDVLYDRVPAGVGKGGILKLNKQEFKELVDEGARWCIDKGYGWGEDLERIELNGRAQYADSSKISEKAIKRGLDQVGTLGSGNHYLEIQHVLEENVVDSGLAKKWGLFPGQIVVMFHCGSRGFGHQVATEYLKLFLDVMKSKYGIKIRDRELASAPFNSPEGQDYFKAMGCAVNMGFANRQTILHRIRNSFEKVFGQSAEDMEMHQVYDISHNRASLEEHEVDGEKKKLIVHRKGATASFGPGRKEVPELYRDDGQPVIIGGSMETGSWLLAGTEDAKQTWYTTAHGSGRTMSRTQAKKKYRGEKLQKRLEEQGIYIKATSYAGLAEEAGGAYKPIDEVVETTHQAGLSKKVAKMKPIGNIKG
ncbi:RNA-splicing ligase RtcB [Candidatus Micrarchaeota archaeon]|nr:RNA-splicing ligase RtcB [Candidatus Micrarchaeota archaeon]